MGFLVSAPSVLYTQLVVRQGVALGNDGPNKHRPSGSLDRLWLSPLLAVTLHRVNALFPLYGWLAWLTTYTWNGLGAP